MRLTLVDVMKTKWYGAGKPIVLMLRETTCYLLEGDVVVHATCISEIE